MKFEIKYKDKIYECEWFDKLNIDDKQLCSVAGFIFDKDGKLCLVRVNEEKGWLLAGGRIEEYDKTPEDAFIRETEEEADLELKNIKRVGYWKSCLKGDLSSVKYDLKFIAEVKKINPQTIDPAYNVISERIFIDPKDFDKYTRWGESGEFQLKKALKMIK